MTDAAGGTRSRTTEARLARMRKVAASLDDWQQRRTWSAVAVAVVVRFQDQDGARGQPCS